MTSSNGKNPRKLKYEGKKERADACGAYRVRERYLAIAICEKQLEEKP